MKKLTSLLIATIIAFILCFLAAVVLIKANIGKKIPFETEITIPEPQPTPNPFRVKK